MLALHAWHAWWFHPVETARPLQLFFPLTKDKHFKNTAKQCLIPKKNKGRVSFEIAS